MSAFDPRITPARPDIAAKHLEGRVEASRFVEGVGQEVIAGQSPMRHGPSHGATMVTEALRGERFIAYEEEEGWTWGQLAADGYVGWLPASALLAPALAPTHKVTATRTFLFPEPSIKAPPLDALPFGAQVAVTGYQDKFMTTPGGFVPARHVAPLSRNEDDYIAVAERFLGAPYLWGGKTSLGIDCSGLVQIALNACGLACPRDSDMQERALGRAVTRAEIRRGDLLFWPGHVAIACGAESILHANAFHMAVAIESLGEALSRIKAAGAALSSVRRI